MKTLLQTIAFAAVAALLAACGPNNPLIGQWESEPMMGISNAVEFKSGAMINTGGMGGMTSSNEIKVKDYQIDKDKVAVVLEQDGSTATMTYVIVDADTILQDLGMAKIRFHRKK
jgi:hypothetical protein